MFLRPEFNIVIDGEPINHNKIYDISIYNSIDKTLPELVFKLVDSESDYIDAFRIHIGSTVSVKVLDVVGESNSNENFPLSISFCSFAVTQIYDGFEANNGRGGFIQVWCTQSWKLYGNYKGQAFAPQKISEIIKTVCKDANPLAEITVVDENINSTSDVGSIPRFKCAESDIDFIENKLIPYTNIDNGNCFFFVNLYGGVYLKSFQSMSSKDCSILIAPKASEQNPQVADMIKSHLEKGKIKVAYETAGLDITVGNQDIEKMLGHLKERCLIYNNSTGKTYAGVQTIAMAMGKNSGKFYANKVPFNEFKLASVEATSTKVFHNRHFDDALAMSFNEDLQVEDIFRLNVTVPSIVDDAVIGDTAEVITTIKNLIGLKDESVETKDKKKIISWLNGKWIIKAIQYNMDSNKQCSTSLELIRPTFIFTTDTTTVEKTASFYTVV